VNYVLGKLMTNSVVFAQNIVQESTLKNSHIPFSLLMCYQFLAIEPSLGGECMSLLRPMIMIIAHHATFVGQP